MKRTYAVVFALLAIFSVALSAAAFESKTIYRQDGVSASAGWFEKTADGSIDKFIGVTETDQGTDIYVSICRSDLSGSWSCKWGYTFTSSDVITLDKKLDSAALSEVKVDLYDPYSPVVETVTVQAQWSGTGEVTKGSYKSISKYGDYVSKYSDSTSWREAIATGSINNMELGQSQFGSLAAFKSASMWMQK